MCSSHFCYNSKWNWYPTCVFSWRKTFWKCTCGNFGMHNQDVCCMQCQNIHVTPITFYTAKCKSFQSFVIKFPIFHISFNDNPTTFYGFVIVCDKALVHHLLLKTCLFMLKRDIMTDILTRFNVIWTFLTSLK